MTAIAKRPSTRAKPGDGDRGERRTLNLGDFCLFFFVFFLGFSRLGGG
jgi:hypothetical protein